MFDIGITEGYYPKMPVKTFMAIVLFIAMCVNALCLFLTHDLTLFVFGLLGCGIVWIKFSGWNSRREERERSLSMYSDDIRK